jgi:hypothetical protein
MRVWLLVTSIALVGVRGRARWSGTAGDVAMKIRGFRTRKPEHRKE